MTSFTIAIIAFACIFGGALLGLRIRSWLPSDHLKPETNEIVKLGAGLMATLAALILSLLVSSAKGTLDTMNSELTQTGAKIILLDRVLANYGPETKDIRAALKSTVARTIEQVWPEDSTKRVNLNSIGRSSMIEEVQDFLARLSPENGTQHQLQSQASQIAADLAQSRWILVEQTQQTVPKVFLAVLLFWLTALFVGFGLLSPNNATSIVVLLVCALSLSGAVFLIIEMNSPLTGVIKVSSAPFQKALANLGR